jgi:TetR/AcrR family transcriptional regulator
MAAPASRSRAPARGRPARPARRARPGGAERRLQILRAASECFGTRGFHGTTTRDIAAAVGITEAALYRYFDGKQAIYTAILDARMSAPDPVAAVEALAESGDDEAVFSGLLRALLAGVNSDPSFIRLLFYSALEGHQLAKPFHEKRIRRLREFLTGYIERRVREGAFRAVDPALGARFFIGLFVDYAIVRQVFGQRDLYPQSPEEFARNYVAIFLDGMRAKPRSLRRKPARRKRG